MGMSPILVVTIDTEVDKDRFWRIANPATFKSITEGVPGILSPLFDRYEVQPTYLLSPEVIEDDASVRELRKLLDRGRAELGSHLHAEFVEPQRTRFTHNMSGAEAHALQRQYPADVEYDKIENLTELFHKKFGVLPTAFRAGRYGIREQTFSALAALGYRVDSSVTPGLRWQLKEGTLDFRDFPVGPYWVDTPRGEILELPISIAPVSKASPFVRDLPRPLHWAVSKVLGGRVGYRWLRPSFHGGKEMIDFLSRSHDQIFVMMFHSTEIVCKASPYAQTPDEVQQIVNGMEAVFKYCREQGFEFRTMSQTVEHVKPQAAACD